MIRDLRHAVRVLLRSKGWTAVVLLSLALGIGANTALFTAVNGLLLQTVAVPDAQSLVRLKWTGENDMIRNSSDYGYSAPIGGRDVRSTFSYAIYKDLRAANQTLTDLAACAPGGVVNVIVNGEADLAPALGVTGNYFRVLGVQPIAGRLLGDQDAEHGAPPVAVISEGFWQRRFGREQSAIGRVVTMNNVQVTIVGVTASSFTGIQRVDGPTRDVTLPLAQLNQAAQQLAQPTSWWLQIVGRRKPGVRDEQIRGNFEGVFQASARAGMAAYMDGLSEKDRNLSTNRRDGTKVPTLVVSSAAQGVYDLDNSSRRSASILGVVVVLVLLIVCANVANLLLSRATSRRKEISVRLSMGATRGRLIRQLLTESLVLSGLGGALGLVVGYWSRQLLPFGQTVPIDWRVFAFVGGVSIFTGLAFGLVPAFRATRVDLAGAMKENSRGVVGSRTILSRGLLVAQVAISLVLLIGAGLFLRTLNNLRAVDVGFNPNNLLIFRVNPQLNRYDADRTALIYKQLQEGLVALPGVRAVALTRVLPLSGSTNSSSIHVRGGSENNNVYQMNVSPSYFDTMNIPILRGRGFNEHDVKGAPRVAVLNETAARKLFPDGQAIGGRLGYSLETNGEIEVVGVVRDTKYSSLRDAAPPTMFSSFVQAGTAQMAAVLRTAGDPNALVDGARAVVKQVDPTLPMTNVTTQIAQLEGRFAQERLFATAYSLFGGLAVILAAIGLFGVMSYAVSRRTNEIGVRMALGARRADVIRMVLGESMILVAIGVALGLGAALGLARLAREQLAPVLFGLPPTDLAAIVAAVVLMAVVSTIAGFLPARRASRVDPLAALRVE
jgi:predicted permease